VEGLCSERLAVRSPDFKSVGHIECSGETINVYSKVGPGGCEVRLEDASVADGSRCLWCSEEDVWQCGPDQCDDIPPWHFIGSASPGGCDLNVYYRNIGGDCEVKLLPK
jgi:hypothetical protein